MTTFPTNWHGAVEMVKRAASGTGRRQSGFYSLEGVRLHERALRAGISLPIILIEQTEQNPPRLQSLLTQLETTGSKIYHIPDSIMSELTQGRKLGKIVGLAKMPAFHSLKTLLLTNKPHPPLFLVAVNVVDPGNIGALIRSSHAFNINACITIGSGDPFHPKAVRTSMGSIFKMPTLTYESLDSLLLDFEKVAITPVAAVAKAGIPLPQITFNKKGAAIIMGGEYEGLSVEDVAKIEEKVTIPITAGIDSLSVSTAAAILLYAAREHMLVIAN